MRDDNLAIRRPELNGLRRQGTVLWFKDEKGYGRITADDGEVLFVHFAHIEMDGYRALEAGQRVSFVWRGGVQDHGRHRAESVRPLSSFPASASASSRGCRVYGVASGRFKTMQ